MQTEELAAIKRVCAMTGLSKTTIYRMIRDGTFPKPVLVGRRALWPVSRIHTWARQQVEANPDERFDHAA
ncbi:MAG: helix-turn-helix transcriptional regulator [Lysobacter sp.]